MSKITADANEIVSARQFSQPPEALFAVFADPARLARWWGPAGFSNSFDVFEFRAGGQWCFTMHGPDGKDYPNRSVFHAVEAPGRIVLEHVNAPHFHMTLAFSPQDSGTLLIWRMRFDDAAARDAVARYALPANEENFDRLQAELASTH